MVRSEIISKLSKRIHQNLKKQYLDKIFQITIDTIIQGIKNGKSTELRGFGRFSSKGLFIDMMDAYSECEPGC